MVYIEDAEHFENVIDLFAITLKVLSLGGVLSDKGPDDGQRRQHDQEGYGQFEGREEVNEGSKIVSSLFFLLLHRLRPLTIHRVCPQISFPLEEFNPALGGIAPVYPPKRGCPSWGFRGESFGYKVKGAFEIYTPYVIP